MIILTLTLLLLTSLCCTSALAAGGDVAGAVEQTWTEAAKQIKSVVEKVVFPALDMILAIKNTFPSHGADGRHHKAEWRVSAACGHHLRGQPMPGLSVAGLRAGLTGARSGLFMEQIRIIQEMRDADRKSGRTGIHIRPRFGIWENVIYVLKCIRHIMSCKQL